MHAQLARMKTLNPAAEGSLPLEPKCSGEKMHFLIHYHVSTHESMNKGLLLCHVVKKDEIRSDNNPRFVHFASMATEIRANGLVYYYIFTGQCK